MYTSALRFSLRPTLFLKNFIHLSKAKIIPSMSCIESFSSISAFNDFLAISSQRAINASETLKQ